jgi:hypothetical protein
MFMPSFVHLDWLLVDVGLHLFRDSNRMDSGRFESVSKPYSFHQVMRGLFVPLRLATDARQLELVTDLDPCIDKVGLPTFQDIFFSCPLPPDSARGWHYSSSVHCTRISGTDC